ncbi:hypothetical protein JCM33374_g2635 [Metschnikowia sp. JCM 33374]|nr:hypothetical protein JCM33374_g2635 [Metschnikowia sp. JCM 33374]
MSLTWNYSYPKPIKAAYPRSVSKDAEISDNLDVGILPSIPEPQLVSQPFGGCFSDKSSLVQENILMPFDQPLDDILAESQAQIKRYQIQLPSQKARGITSHIEASHIEASHINSYTHTQNTPPVAAQHHFETSNSSPTMQNAPTNSNKQTNTATQVSAHFNDIQEYASSGEFSSNGDSTEKEEYDTPNGVPEDITANRTAGDPLACHAQNIMRMAMDSTMLGSFCNDTILSNFSNVLDDSFLAKLEEKSFSEEEPHNQKPGKVPLSQPRAMRFDISAKDLEMAISDPFRFS